MELVVFDMDGTLTRPFLDFRRIRREVQAALMEEYKFPIEEPLLERILRLPEGPKALALRILHERENEAVAHSKLNDGAREILGWLRERDIRSALLTRNRRETTEAVLKLHDMRLDHCVTREDGPMKPDPRSVGRIVEHFGAAPGKTLVVGDFRYDIEAGRGAGARTCLITNGSPPKFEVDADSVIEHLDELRGIISGLS